MSSDFNDRFTHALLILVIILLTANDPRRTIFGEELYPLLLVALCFAWAYFMSKLQARSDRRAKDARDV